MIAAASPSHRSRSFEIATMSRNHKPAMAQQPMAGDAFDEVINDGLLAFEPAFPDRLSGRA
jgi:hypothetical protein